MSIREISRQLQVSRNTVRRYLRDVAAAQRQPRGVRPHKLDPYRTYIEQRVRAAHPAWLPTTVIKQEIALLGYRGGMSRLRQFMRSLRVVRPQEPLVRFETPPGQQLQCDWIVFRRGKHPLSAFVATLGWSRASYVEFVTDERLETLLACHEHAFAFFGGVSPGAVRQHENRCARTRCLRSGPTSLPAGLPGLCRTLRLRPQAVSTLSGQDQGQGRTLQRLPAAQLLQPVGVQAGPGRSTPGRRYRQYGGADVVAHHGQCPRAWHDREGAATAIAARMRGAARRAIALRRSVAQSGPARASGSTGLGTLSPTALAARLVGL
ncbi:IS21 family transposase [Xanthomonas phaseoli]